MSYPKEYFIDNARVTIADMGNGFFLVSVNSAHNKRISDFLFPNALEAENFVKYNFS